MRFPTQFRRVLLRALYGTAAAFAVCGAVELALILVDFRWDPESAPIVVEVPDGWTDSGRIHQKDVATLWRPSPNARIPWGDDERVNADGYRGPLLAVERRPGTLRIATLGDSSTFGHSVAFAQCWSARLAAILAERTGQEVEVLDAGVIGYSVRQGLERWRTLVRAYSPDVVVAAFGAVIEHVPAMGLPDDELIRAAVMDTNPVVMWTRRLRRDLRIAHAAGWFYELLQGGRVAVRERRWQREIQDKDGLATVGAVDWLGTRRVSVDEFERFLLEMRDEVRESGARFVAISMPRRMVVERTRPVVLEYTRRLAQMAGRGDIELVDGRAAFGRALRDGRSPRDFLVDAYHPSPLGHEILATAVADALGKPGPR